MMMMMMMIIIIINSVAKKEELIEELFLVTQSELILCSFIVSLVALGFVLWKYKSGKWTVGYCSNYTGFF